MKAITIQLDGQHLDLRREQAEALFTALADALRPGGNGFGVAPTTGPSALRFSDRGHTADGASLPTIQLLTDC